jgi:hypothetical protein
MIGIFNSPQSSPNRLNPNLPLGERLTRFFTLRPFGNELLSPTAGFWLAFAFILVMTMAILEAIGWGWFATGFGSGWAGVASGVVVGLMSFLVIWTLDASLMTADLSRVNLGRKLAMVGGRICVTLVSAIVVSPFLSQFVFRTEIESELRREAASVVSDTRKSIVARFEGRKAELSNSLEADRDALIAEVSGKGRSGKYGDGITSGAIRERIVATEGSLKSLDSEKASELAAFDGAVAGGRVAEIERRWGVRIPSDSVVDRATRMEVILQRPESKRVSNTVTAFFGIVCVSLVLFKILFSNGAVALYLSEENQSLWRQYRKGAFDEWLPRDDRSDAFVLMSPVQFIAWHAAVLPRLAVARQAEADAQAAAAEVSRLEAELAAERAGLDGYWGIHNGRLEAIHANQLARAAVNNEVFDLQRLFDELLAEPGARTHDELRFLRKVELSLREKRGHLEDLGRRDHALRLKGVDPVDEFNRRLERIAELEASLKAKIAERERLFEAVRRMRHEIASASVGVPSDSSFAELSGALAVTR